MKIKVYIPKDEEMRVIVRKIPPTKFWTHIPEEYNKRDLIEMYVDSPVYAEWNKSTESTIRTHKDMLFD